MDKKKMVALISVMVVILLPLTKAYDEIQDCPRCGGDGVIYCPFCGGDGCIGNGIDCKHGEICPHCHGQGKMTCPRCGGSGYISVEKGDGNQDDSDGNDGISMPSPPLQWVVLITLIVIVVVLYEREKERKKSEPNLHNRGISLGTQVELTTSRHVLA